MSSNAKKFSNLSIFVVPCLNVDGFEVAKSIRGCYQGIRGRLNAHGVDLNRNFPTPNFRSHSYVLPRKGNIGKTKYNREVSPDNLEAKNLNLTLKNCGEFGGSELETQAIMHFVENEKISMIFSFHNSGRDVMGSQDELAQTIVSMYAAKTGYERLDDAEWRKIGQTGTMKDWCDERNIAFVEVEGSSRYHSDRKVQQPAIEAVLTYLNEVSLEKK